MAIRELELQKAVYTNLSTGAYTVLDSPPTEPVLPLITLGDNIVVDSDTKTSDRTVHLVTIHTWSKGNSKAEIYTMNDFVKTAIKDSTLSVTGFNVDNVTTELLTVMKDADYTGAVYTDIDGVVLHGVLQFNVTLSN